MAYFNNGAQNRPRNGAGQSAPIKDYLPEQVPADYVEAAEQVMRAIREYRSNEQISTSKLRNLLSLVTVIFNTEQLRTEEKLLDKSVAQLQMMRIRVLYEAGREQATRKFVEEAKLIEYLKGIGEDRKELIRFAHYMEALVAYHRFYSIGKQD